MTAERNISGEYWKSSPLPSTSSVNNEQKTANSTDSLYFLREVAGFCTCFALRSSLLVEALNMPRETFAFFFS